MSCDSGKLGNKTRIWITEDPSGSPIEWDEITNAVNVTPPDQGRNVVDQPTLNQANDITHRAPGSRNGGDLTLTVQKKAGANDGLVTAASALASGDCVAVCVWPGGEKALAMVMLAGVVTQCADQDLALDGNDTVAITIACNDLYKPDQGNAGPDPA